MIELEYRAEYAEDEHTLTVSTFAKAAFGYVASSDSEIHRKVRSLDAALDVLRREGFEAGDVEKVSDHVYTIQISRLGQHSE